MTHFIQSPYFFISAQNDNMSRWQLQEEYARFPVRLPTGEAEVVVCQIDCSVKGRQQIQLLGFGLSKDRIT